MTDDDLEAVVQKGLHGVTLAKCGHPDDVKRLDWKLDELERRRGIARRQHQDVDPSGDRQGCHQRVPLAAPPAPAW